MSTAEQRGPTRHKTPTPPGCCPWCKRPSPEGRATWHPSCAEEMNSLWPGALRRRVEERDGGVCATCGVVVDPRAGVDDEGRIEEFARGCVVWARIAANVVLPKWRWDLMHGVHTNAELLIRRTPAMRRARAEARARGTWHMDHVTALADGGTNELENLQTLCVPCHKAKSAREAAERARVRRRENWAKSPHGQEILNLMDGTA